MDAYRSSELNPSGKNKIVFIKDKQIPPGENYLVLERLKIPCGQCIGCRLESSRQKAVRCMHESQLYENNCFITLTYDNESLPKDYSLNKKHFQDFMKRLRKKYSNIRIRYMHCGEYGEQFRRPHYHAIIFNLDFPDRELLKTINGIPLYKSAILSELWGHGLCSIGDVTFDSAAYVARYIMKKVNGKEQQKKDEKTGLTHYEMFDSKTGEIFKLTPEYQTMSLKPGLGSEWYDKYKGEVYPSDSIVIKGKEMRPPKYYDSLYELEDSEAHAKIKQQRKEKAKKHSKNNTSQRRATREKYKEIQIKQLIRNLE